MRSVPAHSRYLPDRLVTEALTITSGSPQTAATTGTDSSPAAIERPRPTPSGRGVGALRGCRRWGSTWDFLWHFLIIFAWIAYLLVLFQILGDLFRRDHKTSGWVKAIWVAFLILFPWITALIYLIARGKGMAERAQEAAAGAKKEADDYIRQAAGRSPAQEIADAKALLEAGTITQAEFESLKAKSLS